MAKTPTDIRSLARAHTATAIKVLAGILREKKAPHAARVSAAQALLDRGWGKATQFIDATIRKQVRDLTDDELADIAAGSGEGDTPAQIDPAQLN